MTRRSEKMLKDRRKKWEHKKNLTSEEMAVVFRRLSIRNSLNKPSEVRVRGKRIPMVEVRRYRKRNSSNLRIEASRLRSPTPPGLRVEVYTPPPSSLSTPDHLRLPEEIMHYMRDHILGMFEANTWISVGDTRDFELSHRALKHAELDNMLLWASRRFEAGDFRAVEHAFANARIEFQEVLLQNGRADSTAIDLSHRISQFARRGMVELALRHIEYCFTTTSAIIGSQHPMALTYACMQLYLQMAETNALLEGFQTIKECLLDCFSQALGPFHKTTMGHRLEYIGEVIMSKNYEHGLSALRDVVRCCDEQYRGPKDRRCPGADLFLLRALNVRSHGSHQEKLDLAAKIFERTHQPGFSLTRAATYQSSVHVEMCQIWTDQQQFKTAEFHMREAIRTSSKSFGSKDGQTIEIKAKFEDWLLDRNRTEEANEVRQQRLAAMGLAIEHS